MADLTEEQRKSYWRYNIKLTTILLVIWFVVTYLISGLWAGWLNQFSFPRIPTRLLHGGAGIAGDLRHRDRGVCLSDEQARQRVRHCGGRLTMSLAKIFTYYTIGFIGVTILIGIAEQLFGLPPNWIGWIFMGLSLGIYIVIGIVTRTSNPDQYYVAGRGVPSVFNGMATGSDWMSAASFISMAGALSAQGFAGLAYVMGWTGGYLLLAVFLGPYLRQFGAYTIPDFLGARYGGNFARIIGVVAAIACSFTYLIAQVTGVGLIVSRFIGLDFNIGVFVGLIGVLFCSVLGGMKSVTWTQVAQYIILIVSYLVPVVYLSYQLFAIPIPELTYGRRAADQ